ncbi:MAG: NAD(P)H-binding protein [Rubrivivax sp.]|nr:NAD(P)H-binding protein [Rubrivivax sp.]
MEIALFGATGRTGRLVLDEARRRGWTVRALVRDASRLGGSGGSGGPVDVATGDTRDAAAVQALIGTVGSAGIGPGGRRPVDAVVCALGMHDITVPATDFSDSVKAIVAAMKHAGVQRLVAIASGGVFEAPGGGYRNQQPGFPAYLQNISAEHVRNYETLRASGLDWTLMCPLTLAEDIPRGAGRFAIEALPPGSDETGCADLAAAMCSLLGDRASFGKRVGIVSDRPAAPAQP